ncbi:MAG: 3-deoxy-7-phosphoheptulonate synthase [Clostridia bacterium]|nr:3-deoxy-7-phosphoheptulonate synthase [Clostridia bacterium]
MAFKTIAKIPTPDEMKAMIPLDPKLAAIKQSRDEAVKDILLGRDERFILIIGPCSAHNKDAVSAYVSKLAKVQEQVKDKILIIPRVYTNKPRTTGEGYKGMMHQPDPTERPNMVEGIKAIREMQIQVLKESHLSSADEMLYPTNLGYVEDLLSYIAVGARSVENQKHRLAISGVEVASGMKNPTSGDIGVMLNSIKAAQLGHVFIYDGVEVETTGNPAAHGILRGAVNQYGRNIPNYHYEDLVYTVEQYHKRGLDNPALIVDCNHANSMKKHFEQPRIAKEILHSMKYNPEIGKMVKGLMIESYLVDGRQDEDGTVFGQSITDACIGWDTSEKLIYEIADQL